MSSLFLPPHSCWLEYQYGDKKMEAGPAISSNKMEVVWWPWQNNKIERTQIPDTIETGLSLLSFTWARHRALFCLSHCIFGSLLQQPTYTLANTRQLIHHIQLVHHVGCLSSLLLPWSLCLCYSLLLKHFSPGSLHGWLLAIRFRCAT